MSKLNQNFLFPYTHLNVTTIREHRLLKQFHKILVYIMDNNNKKL